MKLPFLIWGLQICSWYQYCLLNLIYALSSLSKYSFIGTGITRLPILFSIFFFWIQSKHEKPLLNTALLTAPVPPLTQVYHCSMILPRQMSHKHSYFHSLQPSQEWKQGLLIFHLSLPGIPLVDILRVAWGYNGICGVASATSLKLCNGWIQCTTSLVTNAEPETERKKAEMLEKINTN